MTSYKMEETIPLKLSSLRERRKSSCVRSENIYRPSFQCFDRDKKREITSVDCGVILSGQEMTTVDIALFSRLVYLTFTKTEFSNTEKKAFDECKAIRDMGLSHLTTQILRHRSKMETEFSNNYKQCMSDLNAALEKETIEDRIQRNWVIPLAAFRTMEAILDLPFSYKEMLDVTVDGIVRQNKECKSNNEDRKSVV